MPRSSGARRSSAGSYGSKPAPPPRHHSPTTAPQPHHAPPPPAPQSAPPPAPQSASPPALSAGGGGGMMSNIAGSVVGGMASGVGFSVANRAVDALMGPRQMEVVHTGQNDPAPAPAPPVASQYPTRPGRDCQTYDQDLQECFKRHNDISLCQSYMDSLKRCQEGL